MGIFTSFVFPGKEANLENMGLFTMSSPLPRTSSTFHHIHLQITT